MKYKFSLILATLGIREKELQRFIESLKNQTYSNFELIIIDQSDKELNLLLDEYRSDLDIKHIKTNVRGLSRARNIGIQYVDGDIVAFPDDDCWYPQMLLQQVAEFMSKYPDIHGVIGRSVDERGTPSADRWDSKEGFVNKINVWRRCISVTIFLRKEVVDSVGKFCDKLGVGSGTKWGSGEEKDYIVRALELKFNLYYDPHLIVFHPHPVVLYDERAVKRGYSYGMGMGYLLKIHKYPLWFVLYMISRPLGGTLLSLLTFNRGKARFHWNVFKGRLLGYLNF